MPDRTRFGLKKTTPDRNRWRWTEGIVVAGRVAVGLDIGTSGVRAAELALGGSPVTLERFGQVGLPPGAVRDGEVVDVDVVGAAIRQLWAQVRFSTKRVVLGVANQKVVVRQVDLPWLPAAELRSSLPFQVQDFIPMPVDKAILDYHPLEEFQSENGVRMLRMLLVAAARDMVTAAMAAVTKAGLTTVMVDLTPFAVLRALAPVDELGLDPEAEALVEVGAGVTNIVVHSGGVPRFVRILLMGGQDVTEAVAERMGVPLDEAEEVKQSLGMAVEPAGDGADDSPAGRVIEATGGAFVQEVRGSLDYYVAQPTAAPLRRIRLSGGGALLPGLAERLAAATRLPIESASPLERMRVGKTGLSAEQLHSVSSVASVPVGLALGMAS
jgi:type IV pilus assembly protein PilM